MIVTFTNTTLLIVLYVIYTNLLLYLTNSEFYAFYFKKQRANDKLELNYECYQVIFTISYLHLCTFANSNTVPSK